MESRLFGLSTKELRHLASQFTERNKIPHSFNVTKGLDGKHWIYVFLKRNINVSLRNPECPSTPRSSSFSKYNVSVFSLLGQLSEKYKFPVSRIFNCDETGMAAVPKRPLSKDIFFKKKEPSRKFSMTERGTLTTAEISQFVNEK